MSKKNQLPYEVDELKYIEKTAGSQTRKR